MGKRERFTATILHYMGLWLMTSHLTGADLNANFTSVLDDILIGYDKRFPPKFNNDTGDHQVGIHINIYINSMFSISEASMEYSMSMFLRERWQDDRLKYNIDSFERFELDSAFMDKIWIPDVYILNEKKTYFNDVTVPNKMVHIYPDGTVQISMRVTGSISCLMYLQKYPFDRQECVIELESYSKSTDVLKYYWTNAPVTLADGIEFPQFELKETIPYNCEKDYYGIKYPCIGIRFKLTRNYSYYVVQIYIPSMLIVCLSWVNFWLDAESVPARISLGLLTVLTMTTQSSGARANLPTVSYVKAIDVWMAVCLAFVFMGLVEFAYVNVQTRVRKRKKPIGAPKDDDKNNHEEKNCHSNGRSASVSEGIQKSTKVGDVKISVDVHSTKNFLCLKNLNGLERARAADKLSRVLFPAAFVLFNVFYWVYYMLWDPDVGQTHM